MRKPDSRVEIDLMMRRKLVGSPEVQELPGAAALGEIADVFDEGIPGFAQLTVKVKGGLAGEVVRASQCRPIESDLATEYPFC